VLAAVFANGAIVAWDVGTASQPRFLDAHTLAEKVEAMAIHPTTKELALAGRRGSVSIWNLDTGDMHTLPGALTDVVALAYSQDGASLTAFAPASYFGDKTSRIVSWDLASRQRRAEWVMDARDKFTMSLSGHSLGSRDVTISPDGTVLALTDSGTVALWDLESHALVGAFRVADRVESLMFVAGGEYLLAKHFDGLSRLEVGPRRLAERARQVAGRSLTADEATRFLGDLRPDYSA
jgi:WD40 repeat protein